MTCDSGSVSSGADADPDARYSPDAAADSDTTDVRDADIGEQDHPDAPSDGALTNDALTDGSVTDGTDATAAWTPAALPGVVLWLETDWGVNVYPGTSSVYLWSDRSGHANDAIQLDVRSTPQLVFAAIGGRPSLRFTDPSWMTIIDKPSLRWGREDLALVVVERKSSSCKRCFSTQFFFHKSQEEMPHTGLQLFLMLADGKFSAFLTTDQEVFTDQGGYADEAAHLVGVRRRGATLEARVDGVMAGSTPTPDPVNLDVPGRHAHIGAHGYGGDLFQFEGDIAAMIAVKGALSDDDLVRLEAYLLMKYDIPGTSPPARK